MRAMSDPVEILCSDPEIAADAMARRVVELVTRPTGLTSTGYPYFQRRTFEQFRDTVPYLFAGGARLLDALVRIQETAARLDLEEETRKNLERGCRVARQITRTAAITAPTDLWLLRHVLGVHAQLGITDRLLRGEAIHPEFCRVDEGDERTQLDAEQLSIDMHFLLARGLVEQYDEAYRIAGHRRVRKLLMAIEPIPEDEPVPATPLWKELFDGELSDDDAGRLTRLACEVPEPGMGVDQTHWVPTLDTVWVGYLLVPLVLAMRACGLTEDRNAGEVLSPEELSQVRPDVAALGIRILRAAGWLTRRDGVHRVTRLGERGFGRGPGPFGIIQTYHPYLKQGRRILEEGRGGVWVRRGQNIGASQDANRKTFQRANDALDAFCEKTGFGYEVFIEHAIGRGEATRQRFERSGEESIRYFGADLEDAAIDAAEQQQQKGRLPQNMIFVRRADIGEPGRLIEALQQEGVDPRGAVMLVGNGFHEVRDQSDDKMAQVFRGYHDAGILLLFTEENALSIDDLRATAWNTYHAGFKYVHEKSGQCLRPASPRPRPRLGPPLRAAWSECAKEAGYVRADEFCTRTRTIYPYPRRDGHNPSISVNHFFVPSDIASRLGLV